MPKTKKKTSRLVQRPQPSFLPALLIIAGVCCAGLYAVVVTHAATEDPRANAAATELGNFPKLASQPYARANHQAAQVDTSDETVLAVEKTSSTDATVTAYDPAPGEDKHSLFKKLKGQKVKGLVDPDATTDTSSVIPAEGTSVPADSNCWVDITARGKCYAWANLGHSHPQVYFVDHTSSQWPVSTATYQWNQASGIDSVYVWNNCPTLAGIHCVHVVDGYYSKLGWVGRTCLPSQTGFSSAPGSS